MSDYADHRFDIVSRITDMYVNWGRFYDEAGGFTNALFNDGNTTANWAWNDVRTEISAIRSNWGGGTSTIGGRLLSMFDHLNENMGGGEVDMSAILTAMLAATPDEIEQFVGIVDAFRVSIWNRPYNEEFYAALARGFSQW